MILTGSAGCNRLVPWVAIALFLAVFCLFLPTLSSGLVHSDSVIIILQQPFIHDPSNWWNILTLNVVSMDVIDFNRPVHLASLMLDAALWGRNPFGYHLTSNFLHALNAVLVFFVIRAALIENSKELLVSDSPIPGNFLAAAFGALLFAFHPVQCEAVCEPTFREDLQVVFFSLSALLIALRGSKKLSELQPRFEMKPLPWGRLVFGWILCFLASGSKESGLAATAILIAWWALFCRHQHRGYWAWAIFGSMAFSMAFLAFRFSMEKPDSYWFAEKPMPVGGSTFTAIQVFPRIFLAYLGNLFDPSRLSADYTFESIGAPGIAESWLVFSIIAGACAFVAWRSRPAAFGMALFFAPLAFVSNVIPIYSPMADRHFYFPMVGIGMISSTAMVAINHLPKTPRIGVYGAAVCLLFFLAYKSIERQSVWKTSETLFLDTITKNPRSYTAHGVFVTCLVEKGKKEKALHHTLEAIRLMPDGGQKLRLGAVKLMIDLGRREEAAAMMQTVEIPKGEDSRQRHRLLEAAQLHQFLGNLPKARSEYSRYLAVVPDDSLALNNLAWILATDPIALESDRREAVALAYRATQLAPSRHHYHGTLAVALLASGDLAKGRAQSEKAISMARAAEDFEAAEQISARLRQASDAE